ncbi:DUF6506 family protein [Sporolactobacillus shoreicorticis]|uniref:DUF6506 family protein n=1 Tax=Sporolactobacillus shoreicorticis TaxID=1923877 RepID=A0ABW5S3T7_9BACL|nr:DUF6506 family protein [Sporolactobacillus shoreicorticis]MCO7124430.1 DUF6506 family protein [Sporolactobacillus shoreicorticis]
MVLKAAFIFAGPKSHPAAHHASVKSPSVHLAVFGVASYTEAAVLAKELVKGGVTAIELCGTFGNRGIAAVTEAVGEKACVGAVKFDVHPGLDFQSGDRLFLS